MGPDPSKAVTTAAGSKRHEKNNMGGGKQNSVGFAFERVTGKEVGSVYKLIPVEVVVMTPGSLNETAMGCVPLIKNETQQAVSEIHCA